MENRVIKFRYRYTDGTNWIFKVFTLAEICNGMPFEVLSDSPLLKNYRYDGEDQFCGLTDKNGVEIYEGDVLKSESWGKGSKSKNPYHVVVWGECGWKAQGYNGQMKVYPDLTVRKDFEVIGNIYENPELLNP